MELVWQWGPVLADSASCYGSNIKDQFIFSHTPLHTTATSVSNRVTLRVTQRYIQMKEQILICCDMMLNKLPGKTYRQVIPDLYINSWGVCILRHRSEEEAVLHLIPGWKGTLRSPHQTFGRTGMPEFCMGCFTLLFSFLFLSVRVFLPFLVKSFLHCNYKIAFSCPGAPWQMFIQHCPCI